MKINFNPLSGKFDFIGFWSQLGNTIYLTTNRVGIGINTALAKLHVKGNTAASTDKMLEIDSSTIPDLLDVYGDGTIKAYSMKYTTAPQKAVIALQDGTIQDPYDIVPQVVLDGKVQNILQTETNWYNDTLVPGLFTNYQASVWFDDNYFYVLDSDASAIRMKRLKGNKSTTVNAPSQLYNIYLIDITSGGQNFILPQSASFLGREIIVKPGAPLGNLNNLTVAPSPTDYLNWFGSLSSASPGSTSQPLNRDQIGRYISSFIGTVNINVTTVQYSNVLTGISSTDFAKIAVGTTITGTGIQANSYVTKVLSSSSVALNYNATSSGTVIATIQLTGWESINSNSSGGGTTSPSVDLNETYFFSPSGNDATGVPGDINKPFLTLTSVLADIDLAGSSGAPQKANFIFYGGHYTTDTSFSGGGYYYFNFDLKENASISGMIDILPALNSSVNITSSDSTGNFLAFLTAKYVIISNLNNLGSTSPGDYTAIDTNYSAMFSPFTFTGGVGIIGTTYLSIKNISNFICNSNHAVASFQDIFIQNCQIINCHVLVACSYNVLLSGITSLTCNTVTDTNVYTILMDSCNVKIAANLINASMGLTKQIILKNCGFFDLGISSAQGIQLDASTTSLNSLNVIIQNVTYLSTISNVPFINSNNTVTSFMLNSIVSGLVTSAPSYTNLNSSGNELITSSVFKVPFQDTYINSIFWNDNHIYD
jgi:hypothetical protein